MTLLHLPQKLFKGRVYGHTESQRNNVTVRWECNVWHKLSAIHYLVNLRELAVKIQLTDEDQVGYVAGNSAERTDYYTFCM